MPCGWEDNLHLTLNLHLTYTSGVVLAMRHRQKWYYHLRAHGLGKGDEHPAYTQ